MTACDRGLRDIVRHADDFKFNVNLVLIDLFLRLGLIIGAEGETSELVWGLDGGLMPALARAAVALQSVATR